MDDPVNGGIGGLAHMSGLIFVRQFEPAFRPVARGTHHHHPSNAFHYPQISGRAATKEVQLEYSYEVGVGVAMRQFAP
jgi:hypothetical protein